jgi:putative peptidoglycan lipid II flippase
MNLFRNMMTVSGLTMLSRMMGFIRDVLIAQRLGTGPVADAFWVAFRFPNLFRRFFAEGAFNSAFVPLYAKALEGDGPEAAKAFSSEAFSGLTFVLAVFSVIAMVFMPWLIILTAAGFVLPPEDHAKFAILEAFRLFFAGETTPKYQLAVDFTRICFPFLLFMSLVALFSGILNSVHRFVAASAAPILLNLSLVVYPMLTWNLYPNPGYALAWSVTVGGVLQFLLLVWGVWKQGLLPRLTWPRWTPEMKRLVMLGIPGIVAGGITQINILVGTMIATFAPGANSMLAYADRLYQLPLGLIGVAIGVVLLPDISRRLRAGDEAGAHWTQNRALEMAMLLTMPAAVALLVMPGELVRVLYMRGAFHEADAIGTAQCLFWYGAGLPAFVLIKVFQAPFFAREDTATPMRYAAVNTIINIAGSLTFFNIVGFQAIAAATSAGSTVNAALLIWTLARKGGVKLDERVRQRLPRIVLASLLMGVVLFVLAKLLAPYFAAKFIVKVSALFALTLAGTIAYAGFVLLVKAANINDIGAALKRSPRSS